MSFMLLFLVVVKIIFVDIMVNRFVFELDECWGVVCRVVKLWSKVINCEVSLIFFVFEDENFEVKGNWIMKDFGIFF